MMGCCWTYDFGLLPWLANMALPMIGIGAIVYLLTLRPRARDTGEY